MGAILVGKKLLGGGKKGNNPTGDGPSGNKGNIGMKTAEQLLADHRAAQGFGPAPGTSTPGSGGSGSGGAGNGSGNGPPGGMVPTPDTPVDPVDDALGGGRPRRRRGGAGNVSVNL